MVTAILRPNGDRFLLQLVLALLITHRPRKHQSGIMLSDGKDHYMRRYVLFFAMIAFVPIIRADTLFVNPPAGYPIGVTMLNSSSDDFVLSSASTLQSIVPRL